MLDDKGKRNNPEPVRGLTVLTFVEAGTFDISETIEVDLARNYITGSGVQQIHCSDIDEAIQTVPRAQRAILYSHASYSGGSDEWEPLAGKECFGDLIATLEDNNVP